MWNYFNKRLFSWGQIVMLIDLISPIERILGENHLFWTNLGSVRALSSGDFRLLVILKCRNSCNWISHKLGPISFGKSNLRLSFSNWRPSYFLALKLVRMVCIPIRHDSYFGSSCYRFCLLVIFKCKFSFFLIFCLLFWFLKDIGFRNHETILICQRSAFLFDHIWSYLFPKLAKFWRTTHLESILWNFALW